MRNRILQGRQTNHHSFFNYQRYRSPYNQPFLSRTNIRQHTTQTINSAIDDHETVEVCPAALKSRLETPFEEFAPTLFPDRNGLMKRPTDKQYGCKKKTRGLLPFGRIETPIPSHEDQVRQYNVRTQRGTVKIPQYDLSLFAQIFLLHPPAPKFRQPTWIARTLTQPTRKLWILSNQRYQKRLSTLCSTIYPSAQISRISKEKNGNHSLIHLAVTSARYTTWAADYSLLFTSATMNWSQPASNFTRRASLDKWQILVMILSSTTTLSHIR